MTQYHRLGLFEQSANIGKRLVKTPKVYWRNSGVVHALLRIADREALFGHPGVGQSWEGFIIEQTLGNLAAWDSDSEAYSFRTPDGYEVDLVLDVGRSRCAVECTLTSAPSTAMTRRLNKTANMIQADKRVLVCRIGEPFGDDRLLVTNLIGWLQLLTEERPR